jgi:D-psicose/D-tagatose/L-ribulose 3-epimerase
MILSNEDPGDSIAGARSFIGHVHASEPQLAELSSNVAHERAVAALAAASYDGWISIEMRAPASVELQMPALERAIRKAKRAYARVGERS